jgi:hypothetical protein
MKIDNNRNKCPLEGIFIGFKPTRCLAY